ncbi:MAG: sigma-70 family RNA polymerase sigma factor, partial [Deltaproteobacteria bacterium]|nr:sigma-70 family RNA polymerase sigma factor [Deltaproteobacteria bacterium]
AKWGLSAESRAELVQNIFADLWEKRAHFRADSSFETYLFAIARNTLGKEMRRARAAAETGRKDYPEHSGQSYNGLSEPEAAITACPSRKPSPTSRNCESPSRGR